MFIPQHFCMKKIPVLILTVLLLLIFATLSVSAQELSISDQTKEEVYEVIAENVLKGNREIDVSKFNIPREDAENLINSFVWENPEVSFCVTNKSCSSIDNILVTIFFDYDDPSTIKSRHNEIVLAIDKIVAIIDPEWTDVHKVMWINDYICDNFTYDLETEHHTINNLLKTRKGICEAYANLFTALCKRVGIESSYCYSNELAHIWNIVKINNKWYHIDTTWNDSYVERYNYFLISTNEIEKLIAKTSPGITYNLNTLHPVTDIAFDNAFWRDATYSSFATHGNDMYFIKDFKMYKFNLESMYPVDAFEINDSKWMINNGYYTSGFHDLFVIGNYLYYNTATNIYRININTGESVSVYENKTSHLVSMTLTSSGIQIGRNSDLNSDNVTFETITLSKLYIAQYIANGKLQYVQFYNAGDPLVLAKAPVIKGYKFDGWDYTTGTPVNTSLTIAASLTKVQDSYTITFKVDNDIFKTLTLEYGDVIVMSDIPTKTDSMYSYVFKGWEGFSTGMTVSDNHVFTAMFDQSTKTYTITFISGDTTIAINNVEAGSTIEYPTIEQSYVKDGKTFRFIGWSTNPQTALQSEIIYAVYAEEGKTHKVQYYCNGSLFYEVEVPSGSKLTYITDIPTREATGEWTYEFDSWVGQEEGTFVLSDVKLNAHFKEIQSHKTVSLFTTEQIIILSIVAGVTLIGISAVILITKKRKK